MIVLFCFVILICSVGVVFVWFCLVSLCFGVLCLFGFDCWVCLVCRCLCLFVCLRGCSCFFVLFCVVCTFVCLFVWFGFVCWQKDHSGIAANGLDNLMACLGREKSGSVCQLGNDCERALGGTQR